MKKLKVVSLAGVVILIGILIFTYYLAPHLRSLKSDNQVRVIAKYNHVECGETCASFTISKIVDEFPFNADLSASRALAIIGGKEAVIALISSIQKYKSPSFQHAEISNALWIITKRQEYQDNLIEDLAITNDIDRSIVVWWFCKTSKSENLISVFWKLIENDRYGIVRSIATEGLLHWNKLIDDSEAINHPYRYLLIDIADDKNISAVNKAKQELVVLLNGL